MVNLKYEVPLLASCLLLGIFHKAIQGSRQTWDTI